MDRGPRGPVYDPGSFYPPLHVAVWIEGISLLHFDKTLTLRRLVPNSSSSFEGQHLKILARGNGKFSGSIHSPDSDYSQSIITSSLFLFSFFCFNIFPNYFAGRFSTEKVNPIILLDYGNHHNQIFLMHDHHVAFDMIFVCVHVFCNSNAQWIETLKMIC